MKWLGLLLQGVPIAHALEKFIEIMDIVAYSSVLIALSRMDMWELSDEVAMWVAQAQKRRLRFLPAHAYIVVAQVRLQEGNPEKVYMLLVLSKRYR